MDRVVITVAITAVAIVVAAVLRRRRKSDAPTQPTFAAPRQLDRADFGGRGSEWLLVAFTSASCNTCADLVAKASVAASREVHFVEVEYSMSRELHRRYAIDAVPTLVLANREGVVVASFIGRVTATDLWATIAEAREPGSVPPNDGCSRSHNELG